MQYEIVEQQRIKKKYEIEHLIHNKMLNIFIVNKKELK